MKTNLVKIVLGFLLIVLVNLIAFMSPANANNSGVDIYFYHSKTCPHCIKQKPLMEYIAQHNEAVNLYAYEVQQNPPWRIILVSLTSFFANLYQESPGNDHRWFYFYRNFRHHVFWVYHGHDCGWLSVFRTVGELIFVSLRHE
jgi:thiol-disulfide isomerase/thioredoxin